MKKTSNFVCLLTIVLIAAIALTACGDENNEPSGSKNSIQSVEVSPENVFLNGMPKMIDGYFIQRNAKGQVSFIEDTRSKDKVEFEYKDSNSDNTNTPNVVMTVINGDDKEVYNLFLNKDGYVKHCDETEYKKDESPKKEVWDFEYNTDEQLVKVVCSKGESKTTVITYKRGDAIATSTILTEAGFESNHYDIYYTSRKVSSPINNKGCIMSFNIALGVDLDKLEYAYYAGMLGKATQHLPIYNIRRYKDETSFEWIINKDGFPIKVIIEDKGKKKEATFVW